jgi:hypothetical protein
MALYLVIKENPSFPKATHLSLDDDGFQRVLLKQDKGSKWTIGERVGLIVPYSEKLAEALVELRPDGRLDPKVLKKLLGT